MSDASPAGHPTAPPTRLTPDDLVRLTGGSLVGDADGSPTITGLNTLDDARRGELTFLGDAAYADRWASSEATAAVVSTDLAESLESPTAGSERYLVRVDNADLAMARVLEHLAVPDPLPAGTGGAAGDIHPTAHVDPTATLGERCTIGPGATVGPGAHVGSDCVLHAGSHVYADAALGDGCVLWPGVVVRERCRLGDRCTLHSNVVIGTDGFGYRADTTTQPPSIVKVPHLSHVEIGNDVELGACCTIDKGKFAPTTVGDSCKFDNHVVIGHNCRIGRGVMISGGTGVAGSAVIGDFALIGGMASLRDHITIGPGAKLAGCAQVMYDVPAGEAWGGIPARPIKEFMRQIAATQRLPALLKKVKQTAPELLD